MLTTVEKFVLDTLEETAVLSDKKGRRISVVKDTVDGARYIKKQFPTADGVNLYKSLLNISHGNLPRVLYVIETDGGFVSIEEYIDGAPAENLPTERTADAAIQVCDALNVLHGLKPPVIHRDIKPSNIMLEPNGTVKLIDFSAAKTYKEEAAKDTTTLGTVAYAAPEQFGYAKTDARTDIYCLGATMYHWLAAKPYVNGNEMPKGRIGEIIKKCTRIDPADRYQDVSALKKDLKAVSFHSEYSKSILFRTFPDLLTTPGKMAALVVLYVFVGLSALILTAGIIDAVTEGDFFDKGIACAAVVFFIIMPCALICNFFGIRNKLPYFRERTVRHSIAGGILAVIVLFGAFCAVLAVVYALFLM